MATKILPLLTLTQGERESTRMDQRITTSVAECNKYRSLLSSSRLLAFPALAYISAGPRAARSKAFVYGRSPAGIVGSNPTGGMDVCCECLCVVIW